MTRTLILTRHAKSAWDDPAADDHDRGLNKRGKKSAEAIGRWLEEQGHVPDQVLCSTALRARMTWEGMAPALGGGQAEFQAGLYLASQREMLSDLNRARGTCVLMIGHNPGIGYLAEMLAAKPANHPDFFRYPTAATTVMRFDVGKWSDAHQGTGRIVDFVVQRDLVD